MFIYKRGVNFRYGEGTRVTVNRLKDNDRKLFKKEVQKYFLNGCKTKGIVPRCMKLKEYEDCRAQKYKN